MAAIFDDAVIQKIPENNSQAIIYICDVFSELLEQHPMSNHVEELYEEFLEFHALVTEFITLNDMDFDVNELVNERSYNVENIHVLHTKLRKKYSAQVDLDTSERKRAEFALKLKGGFAYTFTDGDVNRIQELLNQLRQLITDDQRFEEQHKLRLLKKLEKLQSEIHKRMSDLDRFYGLVGDLGVVINKFGNDAKPIVSRIKEIVDIVWHVQGQAEQLSNNSKLPALGKDSNEDEQN